MFSFKSKLKQSDECTCRSMSLPLRDLFIHKQFYYSYFCILFTLSLQCCCLSLFYTNIVDIFLFIRWSYKQAIVYHFNDNISIFITILSPGVRNQNLQRWNLSVLSQKIQILRNFNVNKSSKKQLLIWLLD